MPERHQPPRVLVLGSINMDLVVQVPRLPAPGETILGNNLRRYPGGKGANQAVAASRFGAAVALAGGVGDDADGSTLRTTLANDEVNTEHVRVHPATSTGLALIAVADGGENTIVVAPGANAKVSPEDVSHAKGAIHDADVLLAQLEVPALAVHRALELARQFGKPTILNAAPALHFPTNLLQLVDVLVVNRVEAGTLLEMDPGLDPARLAMRLPELGPATVVLTLGSQGAILAHRGRPRRSHPASVKAVDATAAGDAFCGVLAACWPPVARAMKGKDPKEFELLDAAIACASAAGALAATKAGAMHSIPRRDEIEALAASIKMTV